MGYELKKVDDHLHRTFELNDDQEKTIQISDSWPGDRQLIILGHKHKDYVFVYIKKKIIIGDTKQDIINSKSDLAKVYKPMGLSIKQEKVKIYD